MTQYSNDNLKESDESGDTPSKASGVWFDEDDLVDADDEEAPLTTFITTDHSDSQEIRIICKLDRKHSLELRNPLRTLRNKKNLKEFT